MRKELTVTIVFVAILFLPLFDMGFKLDGFKQLNENRELAKKPELNLSLGKLQKLPSEFTKYFNDNFGFRNTLLRVNFLIKHNFFGTSPSSQVIVGKDGWLFYTGDGAIDDYRGITRFDEDKVARWAKSLEMKKAWLEKQGIHYLFIIAPNKSTIYGEFLPPPYNKIRTETALDELVGYLKARTKIEVVDVRPALYEAKSKIRVYQKVDTHWNNYGAFVAYQEIIKPLTRWFPQLTPQKINDFVVERKVGGGGDLTGMVGGSEFLKEEHIILRPADRRSLKIEGINDKSKSPIVVERPGSSLPRAVVFRDSFFSWVAPFLAEHFQQSEFLWEYWLPTTPMEEILKKQKPDVVIEQVVERFLKTGLSDFSTDCPKYFGKDCSI